MSDIGGLLPIALWGRTTAGEQLKYRKGFRIAANYGTPLPVSLQYGLTIASVVKALIPGRIFWCDPLQKGSRYAAKAPVSEDHQDDKIHPARDATQ